MIARFFKWLRKGAPEGIVEVLPKVGEDYSTNLPGVFIIGDLTGLPLLKFAGNSGIRVWEKIPTFNSQGLDAIIIGGGISGISCAIEAKRLGKKILVLESNEVFHTIKSYPKGKPIFSEPRELELQNHLPIQDGTKESLILDLQQKLKDSKIQVKENTRVIDIQAQKNGYVVRTESGETFEAPNLVLAIGKSGDPKTLGIKGEDLPHVAYRFFDPEDYRGQDTVIVGGGDSALEAVISIAPLAKSVCLVHRNKDFSRAKLENQKKVQDLVQKGLVRVLMESELTEIRLEKVQLRNQNKTWVADSSRVLILIGSNPPISLLEKIGIPMEGKKTKKDWWGLSALLGFAGLAYFGKAAFYGAGWMFWIANLSLLTFLVSLFFYLSFGYKDFFAKKIKKEPWKIFRNLYLGFVILSFLFVYFSGYIENYFLFGKYPSFYYTFLYSLTILVFGLRRIYVRKTKYILFQTFSLIFVQFFFLFLLPEIILPMLGKMNLLGTESGFLRTQVFPKDAYWKAYGFILAWPLNMAVLYDSQITTFWLCYGLGFSFVLIPLLVYYFGKGAYCGWICSCGGLAETLGDEHRTKMPHSKFAYKIEHSGQVILVIAFILTLLKLVGLFSKSFFPPMVFFEYSADSLKWIYDLVIDIGLAGVVGVGFYFFYSGRIWCRIFCPLAALMHIYARFSSFRIFSEKKKCISCNICTRNCHQGIDVMNYANKGIPMDSVQCVRCSACVSLCPTKVLSFGRLVGNSVQIDRLNGKD